MKIIENNNNYSTGISTQGQSMFDNWVTKYTLSYSTNGKHWLMVTDRQKDDGSPRVSTNTIKSFSLRTERSSSEKIKYPISNF